MIREGQRVRYAGDTDPFNEVGSEGKVLAISGTAGHVQWTTGPRVGQIDLVEEHELVPLRPGQVEASTPSPQQVHAGLMIRAVYDEVGEEGLVNALSETGHLAMADNAVEEALDHLVASIRQNPVLGEVLGQLEADEADSLAERMASVLLSDRLKEA